MTTRAPIFLAFVSAMFTGPAAAHIGHIGEAAGHGHWVGVAALAGAVALGVWAYGRKRKPAPRAEKNAPEGQSEPAPESEA